MLPPHCAPSFQNGGGAGEENVLSRERRRRREEERPRRRKQRLCGRSASVGLQQSEDAVEVEANAAGPVDATAPPAAATEQRRILVLLGEASADPAEAFLPSGKLEIE